MRCLLFRRSIEIGHILFAIHLNFFFFSSMFLKHLFRRCRSNLTFFYLVLHRLLLRPFVEFPLSEYIYLLLLLLLFLNAQPRLLILVQIKVRFKSDFNGDFFPMNFFRIIVSQKSLVSFNCCHYVYTI